MTEQVDEAYHGYYQTNLYSVNTNFGTADDLKSLSFALHSKGMCLMVDVVLNHMAFAGCPEHVDGGRFKKFNKADYFHPYCPISNMANQTEFEDCWLSKYNMTMPDIKTNDPAIARAR